MRSSTRYQGAPWLTVLFMLSGFLAVFVGPLAAVDVLFNLGRGSTRWGRPS